MTQDQPNRRRSPRVAVTGDVVGRIHTVTAAPILDLSATGALLEVSCALRPGSIYALRVQLSSDHHLNVRSRVVRSFIHGFEPSVGGEAMVKYRAAVEFVEISEAERAILKQHLGREETVLEEEFE